MRVQPLHSPVTLPCFAEIWSQPSVHMLTDTHSAHTQMKAQRDRMGMCMHRGTSSHKYTPLLQTKENKCQGVFYASQV